MVEAEAGRTSAALPLENASLAKRRNNGKLDVPKSSSSQRQISIQSQLKCPECGSTKLYKDGMRYSADDRSVQRFLCRICGYRFSEKGLADPSEPLQKNQDWQINRAANFTSNRQVCDLLTEESNNLATVETQQEKPAGDLDKLSQDARGLVAKYMAYLEREAYCGDISYIDTIKHLLKDGANLLDPEDVKAVIARHKWKDSTKMLATYAYDAFCTMQGIKWQMPKYRQGETVLYIPDEKNLDQLISGAHSRRMATFLQCLKETFADPGEILRLEWIDLKDDVLTINHPVKRHLPGQYQLSPRLVAMLNALPREDKRIFPMTYVCAKDSLNKLRKRLAAKLQNPQLLNICFKSYRHWGGSMLAHYTNGNVLTIKKMLRHRSIQNTMKYIHTIEFKEEDFEETVVTTPEEIRQVGKAGWTKYDEMTVNGTQMHFYRKPKRFGGLKNAA